MLPNERSELGLVWFPISDIIYLKLYSSLEIAVEYFRLFCSRNIPLVGHIISSCEASRCAVIANVAYNIAELKIKSEITPVSGHAAAVCGLAL